MVLRLSIGLILFICFHTSNLVAADFRTISNGDWNDPTIWDQGSIPNPTDNVFIDHSVSRTGNYISNGAIRVSINGSLFIEGIQNNGLIEVQGLFRSLTVFNAGDVLIEGAADITDFTNQLSGTLNIAGLLNLTNLTNALGGSVVNVAYLSVSNSLENFGNLELATKESAMLVSGNFINRVGGTFKICGLMGLGDPEDAPTNDPKSFVNNGTIDGCNGGIAGDNFSSITNNGDILNTVFACIESGNITNSGTGSFTISCCFLVDVEAGPNRRLCQGASTQLGGDPSADNGTEPYTYQWNEVGGGIVSTEPNPIVSPTVNTAYVLTLTDSDTPTACVKRDTVIVRVTDKVIARAGEPKFICEGESVTIGVAQTSSCGEAPYTILWSPAEGLDNPSSPNPIASPSSTTQYIVTITDDAGDVDRDTTFVFIQPRPPAAEAGPDQELCNATSTPLEANEVIGGTGAWSVVSGNASITFDDVNDPKTNVNGVGFGDAVLKWTATTGVCQTEDEVIISVAPPASLADAGDNQKLCDQTSTTMSATEPANGSGTWSLAAGSATIVDINDSQTEVTDIPLDGSTVILTWTVSSGVCSSNSDNVEITAQQSPPDIDVGAGQELCNVTETTISASTNAGVAVGGTWSVVSGTANIVDPNAATTDVNGLVVGGSATLKYTISSINCPDSESEITVTVFEEPSDAQAGPDQVLCAGEETTTLDANSPAIGVGEWKIANGNITIDDPTNPKSTVSDLEPGEFELMWVVSNGSCDPNTDVMTLRVYEVPAVEESSVDICIGDEVQLQAIGGDAYAWSPTDGLSQADIANPIANPSTTTTYQVEIIRDFCPNQILDVLVEVREKPDVSVFPTDTTIIIGESIQLRAQGATSYIWAPEDGLDNPSVANPVASPLQNITYKVTGTNEFGCIDEAFVDITIDEEFEIFVPEMFSPNEDGNNDVLFVNVYGIKEVKFQVYDRLGKVVFATENPEVGWDGRFNGEKQNIDAYPYVVTAETFTGRVITKKGAVQLIR
ncbi:gliding motility-associated C-terminal domain-containing protein [Fulvivirga sp. RKSG066]|uniref:T9SS type B sorting domain-containing protein n=1 Tax=Fulvivirga aurantia TaxID=2529383 RepID=UPI0012BBABA5|nr:gliding motility-associated C-terminal domain-containing protein [Fulvivirga aurantia]MTI20901.1 gliding motility-associated C-terminal domain-containing protein [Fulvivirga aurantia]